MRQDDGELSALRRRLTTLTDEARRNEEAWQRAQRREMALLEATTLGDLLQRLTDDLRASYRLTAATLVLADPEHEIRHLLLGQGGRLTDFSGVLFVDSMHALAPQLSGRDEPWLGPFVPSEHSLLFPANVRLRTVALLPLLRENSTIGSINMGSDRDDRFTDDHATDFLRHLAVIGAFCLENAANRARLVRSGFTDALTGWHNRRYLQSRLREEVMRCRRDRSALTCLMIDVDHFKRINDRHGHLAGDEILQQVARRIGGAVRGNDVAARYGGEEFVVLMPGTGHDAGRVLAERIRRAVADEPFKTPDSEVPLSVTVSIGVAEHRTVGASEDAEASGQQLLARADVALYEAKTGGRNSVVLAARS